MRERFDAALTWLPFDLHPEYPAEGIPRAQLLRRYGPAVDRHVRAIFERAGLRYNPHPEIVPNSRHALRLAELARDLGKHDEFHDSVMDAYWDEARNIGADDELRELAEEVALPADDVERVLTGDEYAERVAVSTQQAASLGITGIPAFLLDSRLLVLGAQPEEVFERALAREVD
jgi:predicted DsbA family dithiol-disulfide isomerase